MDDLPSFTTPLDWVVVAAYLALATLLAWCVKGRQESRRDFFLAGRTLPWPVVAASIAATEIGVAAFLILPGVMMAWEGDFTRLQWVIGAILARAVVAGFFVKRFYEGDHHSPYDFIGSRLGRGAKGLATVLFLFGGLLAHLVRLLLAAVPLHLVTPLPLGWCLVLIATFAVLWTLPGGMRSVAWTDLANLLVVLAAGFCALLWMVDGFADGWATLQETARSAERFDGSVVDKLKWLDFRSDPALEFTFWVSIFAVPFLHVSLLGVDQSHAQPLFCCRGPREARKAILWSVVGQVVVLLMMLVGIAIFVFYRLDPPTDPVILKAMKWSGGAPGEPLFAFPVWIVTEMPTALRGLMLAGIIAVAVSSFDSFLVAIGQIHADRYSSKFSSPGAMVSRIYIAFVGALLGCAAFTLFGICEVVGADLLALISRVPAYTAGPLLALFLAALAGRGRTVGFVIGTALSMFAVAFSRRDLAILEENEVTGGALAAIHSELLSGKLEIAGTLFASPWGWPLTSLLTLACGWDYRRKKPSAL